MVTARKMPISVLLAFLMVVASLLSGCGSRTTARPAGPTMPGPTLQDRSEVLILPLGRKMEEELSYWTLESQRLVLAYFDIFMRHGFENATTARVVVSDGSEAADSLAFEFQSMGEENGSEWWAYVPQGGRIAHEGRFPDYVLIFDGLRFRIVSSGGSRQTYDAPGAGRVEVDLEYLLWDNRAQEVVASGVLRENAYTNSPHASSETFKDLFEKMAEKVVRETPLSS